MDGADWFRGVPFKPLRISGDTTTKRAQVYAAHATNRISPQRLRLPPVPL